MKVNKKRTNFGHIDESTSPISIDPDLAKDYPAQVVQYAEKLKGQHYDPDNPEVYSDSFFLEYASKMLGIMRLNGMACSTTLLNPCPDSRFAEYSYEEIINMAQNGFVVPKDVLDWALAQQSADISDYIVVSDEMEMDDNTSTDSVAAQSDITQLRKLAKEYIVKSSKYQNILDQDNIEMDELTTQVNSIIAEQKKNADTLEDLSNLINKWKNLDKKNKRGKLSESEKDIYKDLSNRINSSKKALDEIETSKEDLDEFLGSIKDLRIETDDALTIAQETLDASYNLSNLEKQVSRLGKTQSPTFVGTIMAGMLTNVLAGVTDETISYVAEQTGKNLQTTGNNIISDLTGTEKKELQEFAFDYSTRARELVIFVNNNFDNDGNLEISNSENYSQDDSTDESDFLTQDGQISQAPPLMTAATLASSAAMNAGTFLLNGDNDTLSKQNPLPPEDIGNPQHLPQSMPLRLPTQNTSIPLPEFTPVSGNYENKSINLPLNNLLTAPTEQPPNLQPGNSLSPVAQGNPITPIGQTQQNQSQIILQSDNNRSAAGSSYMAGIGEFSPDNGNRILNRFQKDLIIESKRKSRIVTGTSSTADRQGNYY